MENFITMVGCLMFAGFGVLVMLYIQGRVKAGAVGEGGSVSGPRVQSPAPTRDEGGTEQKKAEEIGKQWDNLLNYTGTVRGNEHE